MNIPTELTPIWHCWHEADGCSSYVKRCYRRLTVKICYLNRVACWRRVACRLLSQHTWIRLCKGHWYKTELVKLFNSGGQIQDITLTYPPEVYFILNIVNLNGGETTVELFWEHYSSIQFQVFPSTTCTVLKKWCSCKGRGNRPPTDPLFASSFTFPAVGDTLPFTPSFYVLKCYSSALWA